MSDNGMMLLISVSMLMADPGSIVKRTATLCPVEILVAMRVDICFMKSPTIACAITPHSTSAVVRLRPEISDLVASVLPVAISIACRVSDTRTPPSFTSWLISTLTETSAPELMRIASSSDMPSPMRT